MKTEFHLDYPTILANQARPVHFAIRFEAGEATKRKTLKASDELFPEIARYPAGYLDSLRHRIIAR